MTSISHWQALDGQSDVEYAVGQSMIGLLLSVWIRTCSVILLKSRSCSASEDPNNDAAFGSAC